MKSYYKILILINILFFSVFAETTIKINSISKFEELLTAQETKYDSINLHISNIYFYELYKETIKPLFKNWTNLSAISSLTFQNLEYIDSNLLSWFLNVIPGNQLSCLKLIDLDISGDFQLPYSKRYPNLTHLSIIKTKLKKEFFNNVKKSNLPNLKHLEIINCDLNKDFVPLLHELKIWEQIEYLDLSQNEITNAILAIFPYQTEGVLKTLKLNRCGLVLNKDENYSSYFPAISSQITSNRKSVDWNNSFFINLNHLELQHNIENMKEIEAIIGEKGFHNLKIFLGFIPKDESGKTYTTKSKNIQRKIKFFELISKYSFKSIRNNYPLESPVMFNIFLQSDQAKISENIILSGDRWNYLAVRTLLESNSLPVLKDVSVIDTPLTQAELKKLIDGFGNYSFNAVLRSSGEYWPGISEK